MYEARKPFGGPRALTVLTEIVTAQEREIGELKDVLSTIVENDPFLYDDLCDYSCFFCGADKPLDNDDRTGHYEDCPYLAAQKLLESK
jgi:hypothetical protein